MARRFLVIFSGLLLLVLLPSDCWATIWTYDVSQGDADFDPQPSSNPDNRTGGSFRNIRFVYDDVSRNLRYRPYGKRS